MYTRPLTLLCFKLTKEPNTEGSEYSRVVTVHVHLVRKG